MPAEAIPSIRSRAQVILALASILERLEASAAVDAGQYQVVVERLKAALAEPLPPVVLDGVLSDHPAAQAIYENLRDERGDPGVSS